MLNVRKDLVSSWGDQNETKEEEKERIRTGFQFGGGE